MITQEELKILTEYDPETGIFTARHDFRKMRKGDTLGWGSNKYLAISIKGKDYYLHRLAFLYMTGKMPKYVDHINGLKDDNRWSNLRECTNQQNTSSVKVIRSIHGLKGVTKNRKKFAAQIMFNYKKIHLGSFNTPEEAHAAYLAKAKDLYGDFANAGEVHRIPKPRESSNSMDQAHPTDRVVRRHPSES